MKIVINARHGGFTLSVAQQTIFGTEYSEDASDPIRLDPRLVECVEAGDAGGEHSALVAVEIPGGAFYGFGEHAGYEWIYWSMSEIYREMR